MEKINKSIYYKVKNKICMIPLTLMLLQSKVFATSGSISTAEVNQATENIKNAVIKLAMPIRWNIGICKHCGYSIENDCQLK